MNKPAAIYVHHSASAESTSVEEITRWHVEGRGFRTIGYHKVINLKGGVVVTHEGRRETEVGAHTQGHNTNSLGVCVAGNYSVADMKAPVYEELLDVVGALMRRYGIPASQVFGHREAEGAATECPGLRFDLKKLRADLALRA